MLVGVIAEQLLLPTSLSISAELADAVVATDAPATSDVIFATLVDDPASVRETVDAYLGEIMVEAASADDTVTAGSAFAAAIDEAVTAADAQDATVGGAAIAREAMLPGILVNSSTVPREANANGVMVNL